MATLFMVIIDNVVTLGSAVAVRKVSSDCLASIRAPANRHYPS
ncbi:MULTISPECIES: hypothetical protein [unclassified Pseudomonas]